MTTRLDTLSPLYMGEDKITVALDPLTDPAFATRAVTITFDYADADAQGGLVLPVVVTIQPPNDTGAGYVRRVFSRTLPPSVTFTPQEAGEHFLLIRESGHNLWQGRLAFQVEGERFSKILTTERV